MHKLDDYNLPHRLHVQTGRQEISVHTLGEFIFCPRAAILSQELPQQTHDDQEGRPARLDHFFDFDEHRFAESIHATCRQLGYGALVLVVSCLVPLALWRYWSPMAGLISTLPPVMVFSWICQRVGFLIDLHNERQASRCADILHLPVPLTEVMPNVNWWSLRKAGYECQKLVDPLRDPLLRLVGSPWRVLVHANNIRIPVIYKSLGEPRLQKQHFVRAAAYCRLIETTMGGESPFCVLLFKDSSECYLLPNTHGQRAQLEEELQRLRTFLDNYRNERASFQTPIDNRCANCEHGKPKKYVHGQSDTIIDDQPVVPLLTQYGNQTMHSTCGDRFQWRPPHRNTMIR